jgi:hypothetical protein
MILIKCERTKTGNQPDVMFFCHGCKCGHGVWTTQSNGHTGAIWTWNGSMDKPTFSPSILVTGRAFTESGKADYDTWYAAGCPDRQGRAFENQDTRCHSFVRDGKIQFLSDCTHKLAGQTVDMVEV